MPSNNESVLTSFGPDAREQLWIAVVVETIREAGAIRDGAVFDRADEAVERFDRKFGGSNGN